MVNFFLCWIFISVGKLFEASDYLLLGGIHLFLLCRGFFLDRFFLDRFFLSGFFLDGCFLDGCFLCGCFLGWSFVFYGCFNYFVFFQLFLLIEDVFLRVHHVNDFWFVIQVCIRRL